MEIVLKILFLSFSNGDFELNAKKFTRRLYTTNKALCLAKKVEMINKYVFVEAALNRNSDTFVVYVANLEAPKSVIPTYFP